QTDVGPERDLQTAAEGHTVHRCDHGYRNLGPHPGGLLGEVRWRIGAAARERAPGLALHGHEAGEVEPGAERAPFAGEHDSAERTVGGQRLAGIDQRLKHRMIERVELLGAVPAYVGDAPLHRHGDPLAHEQILLVGDDRTSFHAGQPRASLGLSDPDRYSPYWEPLPVIRYPFTSSNGERTTDNGQRPTTTTDLSRFPR